MKILQLISIHQWTGPAEYVLKLCKFLKENNNTVLVGFRNFYSGKFKEKLLEYNIDFTEKLQFPRGLKFNYIINDYKNLEDIINIFSPDIVHCHNSIENILTLLIKYKKKDFQLIRSIHNSKYLNKGFFSKTILKKNDFLITNCLSYKKLISSIYNYPENKIEVIHGFVDIKKFSPMQEKNFLHEKYNLNNSINIGMVARFQPHRGHQYLINAFNKILKDIKDIKLILIGRGENLKTMQEYVKKLNLSNKVIFTGYISDELSQLLNALDIFVLLQEGSDGACRAVLEAMATGLPIITVNKGALKETVKEGKNGFLIESKESVDLLADRLKKLIINKRLREKMGNFSRKLVEENFSEEKQLQKYYNFYRKILNERNN